MAYNIEGVLPDDVLTEVDPGTNLLVSGPAMSGKRELVLRLLARGVAGGDGAVIATSRDGAGEIVGDYRDVLGGDDLGYLRVIDAAGSSTEGSIDGAQVYSVSSPGDLTGIGVEFSKIARDAEDAGVERLRVGFDSLSPLLMYVDLQRLFRFLHVFTSQIQSHDWLGLFAIDPDSHDAQQVNTISQLFDGIIEIRLDEGGGREVRVRGVTTSPTAWVPLE